MFQSLKISKSAGPYLEICQSKVLETHNIKYGNIIELLFCGRADTMQTFSKSRFLILGQFLKLHFILFTLGKVLNFQCSLYMWFLDVFSSFSVK